MLQMGVLPPVAAASSACMIMFTSAAASAAFYVFGCVRACVRVDGMHGMKCMGKGGDDGGVASVVCARGMMVVIVIPVAARLLSEGKGRGFC
jgi:hypothetical protein